MLTIVLSIIAGFGLGLGVGARLAIIDTRRNIHGPSMTGPKLRNYLMRWYWLLVAGGIGLWILAAYLAYYRMLAAYLAYYPPWYSFIGFLGAIVGIISFNLIERKLTKGIG